MIKFTIITICFNCEAEIHDTIQSVLSQTCMDYEYLIKDGASKDGTVGIAESHIPTFAEKKIPYRIISQEDTGIYDAMNCATRAAQCHSVLLRFLATMRKLIDGGTECETECSTERHP